MNSSGSPALPWAQRMGRPWAVLLGIAFWGWVSIHPGSQQTGIGDCPVSFAADVGSLAGVGSPPANLEACVRRVERPLCEAHPLSSVQLAKFSEDTLSSYTEAVSTQVRSPGRILPDSVTSQPPGGSWSPSLHLTRAACRCPAHTNAPSPHPNFLVPPGLFPLVATEAGSWEMWLCPKCSHGLSPARKCCAAFGATFCG